ncbi:MAG: DUF1501 domain-containing protein [Paludisphaera borealis]|uniref:DUF1501 domain-containing protein n=1 Tax=Paludisphaera borealis TaxID=1387353 RepID=UPI002849B4A6|nr:DUF1501 domain-containing protein [Paludisphaera borealis]MDR3618963.1 DUF1501 domain-containing protein [Paludisphaera borealis]
MLKIPGESARDCDGLTRRSFLQVGTLGLGGLALPEFFRLRAQAAGRGAGPGAGARRSVILIWLSGGPGHMETWDPKPDASSGFRGPFGAIGTSLPGVHLGELMPEQAKRMDKLAVLRTVNHGTGDHTKGNHWMLTGYEGPAFNAPDNTVQRRPSIGSAVARLTPDSGSGMPSYVAVPNLRGGTDNLFHYASYLGGGSNPFVVESDPNDPKYRVRNLSLPKGVTLDRLEDRRRMLAAMDQVRRDADTKLRDLDAYHQRAFSMLTGRSVAKAFDISAEDPRLRDKYGRHTFGQSALLARRLVEAGTPFVTVNCVPWDHHGTAPQLKTEEGARKLIPPLDCAIGALIDDLIVRGLYDSTLVVAMGEFGRTPRMNKDAGRDHWGNAFSVLMGCGSMRMGQVIGRSSERGEHVVDRPISPQDVAATVYHHLGVDARSVTFDDHGGRPTRLIENGEPIRELVG